MTSNTSCHGCRALRQACRRRHCLIKPCLQWLQSPLSQANATLFLSKFYGRAGLVNLITAGPAHLRPEIFKSLLYEASGRIINPVHGSVGLLRSGDEPRWEAAVEAVLKGVAPIVKLRTANIQKVSRGRFKRPNSRAGTTVAPKFTVTGWDDSGGRYNHDSPSVEVVEPPLQTNDGSESGRLVTREPKYPNEIGLELKLA